MINLSGLIREKAFQENRKLTYEKVASESKIPKTTLVRMNAGKNNPSLKTLKRLSVYFGKSVEELIKNENQQ